MRAHSTTTGQRRERLAAVTHSTRMQTGNMFAVSSVAWSSIAKSLSPAYAFTRAISTTAVMCAEPMKKKKKLDITMIKMRHERKIRKVEKAIRQLKKTPRQLKPIEEYKLPPAITKEISTRTRPLSEEDEKVMETLEKMKRLWIAYKAEERAMEQRSLRRVVAAQQRAVRVLQAESEALYQAAVAIDPNFLPFEDNHIVTETAPNPEYVPPDGAKVDISKEWTM